MSIKKIKLIVMLGITYLALPFYTQAQIKQDLSAFDKGTYASKTDTLPYRILFPRHFDAKKKYPLLFVLHGAGERGNDNTAQLAYGTGMLLNDTLRDKYPAIVVLPQCPKDGYWSNVDIQKDDTGKRTFHFKEGGDPTPAMHALLGLVDQFLDKPYVNKKQVYVGGLSMGGMGTLEILRRKPKVFAAAFAMCGGDNTNNVEKYANRVPLWIFHGAKDTVVPIDHSEAVVAALRTAGAEPKFTIYPTLGHNCWDKAFSEPDLIPWLFSNVK
ncbi:prolyl oligopeptidase family serine peptidase [Mucilaginibacter achroorhodeus]|uniref:Prolyl oligopeptidase family serine peptidase n=1 Tax=Mucilaginibacter achroorhodeus TaxID=2599294 RepID=A0A563TX06_9SPHI|nr:prolyl oligopeptidase family serine peptidase [Mucilaginibacter achroorhodeus]TWR23898.1 prolyl oligopeptidase family serine peptidase [Mucilaginibacter achroorhodeus]